MHVQEVLLPIMHACDLDHQALGCAYGDKTRRVLEQTMLWNGQRRHNNNEIKYGSKSFKQVVHTQVENKASMKKEPLLT
jgi:hypothetical protein